MAAPGVPLWRCGLCLHGGRERALRTLLEQLFLQFRRRNFDVVGFSSLNESGIATPYESDILMGVIVISNVISLWQSICIVMMSDSTDMYKLMIMTVIVNIVLRHE